MMRYILILIFTCACFISKAQVNIITTIAGKDTFGYSGDGGPATNAKLKAPADAFPDQYGNIYVADALNHRIRAISVSGIISTFAGKGTPGFSGDGGDAINAEFEVPQAVFVDNNNSMFICDGVNNRIRKIILSTGIVTTIAGTGTAGDNGDGGLAINAELNQPGCVFVDKNGNVLIADWANDKIRVISSITNKISTFAGTGIGGYSGDGGPANSANLDGPAQIYADTSGNILISDQYNNRVRKVDVVTGIITTVAGIGSAGYSGDGGLATNARLNQPAGIFVDKQNNILIAEYGNGTVRKIDAITGIINTVAGIGITGFSGDGGPATNAKLFCSDVFVDRYGNLVIADLENNRIRKVSSGVLVNGIDKEIEGKLYPNPTKGAFTIQTPMNIAIVSIYNIAGMRVYEQTCTTPQTEVDITNQSPGIYIVYVQCGEKQYVSKIVKQ